MKELAHQQINTSAHFFAHSLHSRIAPTPSGYLHLGNIFNFVKTWLLVRKSSGSLRLRIDDLDSLRLNPAYLDDIFRTLEWLKLDWDIGAQTVEEHTRLFSQQHRLDRYQEGLTQLIDSQQVYACTCSRAQLQNQMQHACPTAQIRLNEPNVTWRIRTNAQTAILLNDKELGQVEINLDKEMPDFVVRRKDTLPAYQVACVLDDIDHHINCIVRGQDLLPSSAAQFYLSKLWNFDEYQQIQFYHHSLVLDETGQKLSKSAGSASIQAWRESNKSPETLYLLLSEYLKLPEKVGSLQAMLDF